jgi:Ca2+-binding EF-hand superfamily protein
MTRHIPLAIALAVFAGAAAAGETAEPRVAPPAFEAIDANQDGAISRDEASRVPALSEGFDAMDADGDGRVSLQEYTAAMSGSVPG